MTQEWDLHTGKKLRAFPSQNVQLSSLALQPLSSGPSAPPSLNNSISYSTWVRNPTKEQPPTTNGHSEPTSAARPESSQDNLNSEDVEMASPSRKSTAPATDGGPSVAPSEIDAEGEPDLDDDLFGDSELDGLAAGLDLPVELLDSVPAVAADAALPGKTLAAAPAAAPLALPNGTAKPNGVVPKLEPNGIDSLPLASASADAATVPTPVARSLPSLSPATHNSYSPDVLMTSAIDGSVVLWDRRVSNKEAGGGRGVGRLEGPERTPKWCMSVRNDPHCQWYAWLALLTPRPYSTGLLQFDWNTSLGWPTKRRRRYLGCSSAIECPVGGRLRLWVKPAQEPKEPRRLRRCQLPRCLS